MPQNPLNKMSKEARRMHLENQALLDELTTEFGAALTDIKFMRTAKGRLERIDKITTEIDNKVLSGLSE